MPRQIIGVGHGSFASTFPIEVGFTNEVCPITPSSAYDQGPELEAWFAGLSNGTNAHLLDGASYRVDSEVDITDKLGLHVEMNGATIFGNIQDVEGLAGSYSYLRVLRVNDFAIRGGTIRGHNTSGGIFGPNGVSLFRESQHGIRFMGQVEGALVEDMTITSTYGDAVYGGGVRGLTIRRVDMSKFGRHCVGAGGVDGLLIDDCDMGDARWSAIDVEPLAGWFPGKNVRIHNSRFGLVNHFLLAFGGKFYDQVDINVEFINNVHTAVDASNVKRCVSIHPNNTPNVPYLHGVVIEGNTFLRAYPALRQVVSFRVKDNLCNDGTTPAIITDVKDCHDGTFDGHGGTRPLTWDPDADCTNVTGGDVV